MVVKVIHTKLKYEIHVQHSTTSSRETEWEKRRERDFSWNILHIYVSPGK
jgi:hypothetical protein